jgi:hypothetical protein
MKILLPVFALLAVACFAGCDSTAQQLTQIRLGMTQQEVIAILGQPESMSAQGNVEYYTYYLDNTETYREQPYLVRFANNKVESFGRFAQLNDLYMRPIAGAPPAGGLNPLGNPYAGGPVIAGPAAPAPDLVSELTQLKALKDQGVLTDAEFQQAKEKLLSGQR